MKTHVKHLNSLVGRTFLLAEPSAVQMWNGVNEKSNSEVDYDLLEDYISYDEGDLTSFTNSEGLTYYVYFSMSSKIEIFSIENGFIICDGLYFNESLSNPDELIFEETSTIDFTINIDQQMIYLFDATEDKQSVILSEENSSLSFSLENGTYSTYKVETNLMIDGENVILKGIQVVLSK